ncbi:uncharacterized protein [Euphorbia lathyris]|uniref:uncharacterized protein isoform X2 n=1 Tax=Euphorbia lathyris TaxID=212925 RepID=UPI003313D997
MYEYQRTKHLYFLFPTASALLSDGNRIPQPTTPTSQVRLEEIGRSLRCECIVTEVFGRSSEPEYAETAAIFPGLLLHLQTIIFLYGNYYLVMATIYVGPDIWFSVQLPKLEMFALTGKAIEGDILTSVESNTTK